MVRASSKTESSLKNLALLSCFLSVSVPALAQAAPAVYPGCPVPALKPGHHTFYVDPAKGSPNGDGSAAKPWRTLAEVLKPGSKLLATQSHKARGGTDPLVDVNPTGPIKAGDVIMLMSGNHGDLFIQNAFNKDFITVEAAPGQTPILRTLVVQSSQNWMFQGISVISGTDKINTVAVVSLSYGDWLGSTSNIVFDNATVATVEDSSQWDNSDWMSKPKRTGILTGSGATCLSITNSRINSLVDGIGVQSQKTLVAENTIEHLLNDGIDVVASNVTIKGNSIKNGKTVPQNVLHVDGIQGWSQIVNGVPQINSNVVIDGNSISHFDDGTGGYSQGIDVFDGKWNNLTIINNSVAVNTWNGIIVMGVNNTKIINNTVFATNQKTPARIMVRDGKDGSQSKNVVVRNNLAPDIGVDGVQITLDHNIVSGAITYNKAMTKKGQTGDKNVVSTALAQGFVNNSPLENQLDLRLKSASIAVGFGNTSGAPSTDIGGKARGSSVDAGAYAH